MKQNMKITLPLYKKFQDIELCFEILNNKKVDCPDLTDWLAPAMAIGACFAGKEELFNTPQADKFFEFWESFVTKEYRNVNREASRSFLFADALLFASYSIYKNAKKFVTNAYEPYNKKGRFDKFCYEYAGHNYFERNPQSIIDEHTELYNNCINYFASLSSEVPNGNIYTDLMSVIEKEDYKNSPLLRNYFYCYEKDSRCFATYETKENRYVAFSGFVDTTDDTILSWLKETRKPFVTIAQDICNSLNAVFVNTSKNIYRYTFQSDCNNSTIVNRADSLGDLIARGSPKELRGQFACSERKIIAYFFDTQMPDGTLYIKFQPCGQCVAAIVYEANKGTKMTVICGLKC